MKAVGFKSVREHQKVATIFIRPIGPYSFSVTKVTRTHMLSVVCCVFIRLS